MLDGSPPFLSGWGLIDVVHTAARTANDEIVWLIVDAVESDALPPEVLRLHASLALGVASRCCRLLGPSPLDEELAALRTDLDDLRPVTAARRAAAGELAVRAAAALAASAGSRTLLRSDQAQRLWREALFVLVYALRPASRDALLARLGAA